MVPWQYLTKLLNTEREAIWFWRRHSRLEPSSGHEKGSIPLCLSAFWLLLSISTQLRPYLPMETYKIMKILWLKHQIYSSLPSFFLPVYLPPPPPSTSFFLLLFSFFCLCLPSLFFSFLLYFISLSRISYFWKVIIEKQFVPCICSFSDVSLAQREAELLTWGHWGLKFNYERVPLY